MIKSNAPSTHIIIVNYNAGDWLQRAVKTALAFSYGQVTVVDNNSTDTSIADAQEKIANDRLNWVLNTDNRGFAAANNQVLSKLDADYAVLMNPDCELADNTLANILSAFANEPDMGLASCRILNSDGSLQTTCRRRFPTPWLVVVRMLLLDKLFVNNPRFSNFDYGGVVDPEQPLEFVEAISGAFMVVRQPALSDVGLLDEDYFMHCEDLDWCKRFELAAWKVGFIASTHVTHAKGISSQSRPIGVLWTLHCGMNRFFNKFYKDQTALPLRLLVKIGIGMSFIIRVPLTWLRSRQSGS